MTRYTPMATLRAKLIRLAHSQPDLRPHLLPLLSRVAAEGHRLLRDVNASDYKSLLVTAAYDTSRGPRWHSNLMEMAPRALDDRSQWTDAKLGKFAEAVERAKGTRVTLVRIYGRRVDDGTLETLIDWSPLSGFMTEREAERVQKDRAKQLRQEQADRKNVGKLLEKALQDAGIKTHSSSGSRTYAEVVFPFGQGHSGSVQLYIPATPKDQFYWSISTKGLGIPGLSGQGYVGASDTPVREVVAEVARQAAPPILTHQAEPADSETGTVWSVAQTGYEVGGDAEEEYQSYVAEVELFDSKADAIAYAKDIGGATVVKGTQMWNEPMGQVEEHDRMAWTRYYR